MEPITTAIVAAVTAGVTDIGKKAVGDTSQGLKGPIKSKFDLDNKVSKAIAELEDNPESKRRRTILAELVPIHKSDNLFEIKARGKFNRRHMADIPRIKFFAQRGYRANWPFVDGHESIVQEIADRDPDLIHLARQSVWALEETEQGRLSMANYQLDVRGDQISLTGEKAHIKGWVHVHKATAGTAFVVPGGVNGVEDLVSRPAGTLWTGGVRTIKR